MTTITIERAIHALENNVGEMRVEGALNILRAAIAAPARCNLCGYQHGHQIGCANNPVDIALSAPATAPEAPVNWAQMIHYPECWDTAAYPELRDAIHEALAWSGCSVCKPATAPEPICTKCGDVITAHDPGLCGCCLSTRDATLPSWHDAPTCAGLWLSAEPNGTYDMHKVIAPVDFYVDSSWLDGSRYYGPIPPDFGDKQ